MRFRTLSWQKKLFRMMSRLLLVIQRRAARLLWLASKLNWQKWGSWLLLVTVVVTMLVWNWRLLLATVVGVGLMLLVYLFQNWNWQAYWLELERFFRGSNKNLAIAVGSGGIASLSTYIATSIWISTENRWLATGAILQGLATISTFGLLLWHILTHRQYKDERQFDLLVNDLTHPDPLKRLLAVRKLTALGMTSYSNQKIQLLEYFQLMLSQESELIIQEAILNSLQALDPIILQQPQRQPIKELMINN